MNVQISITDDVRISADSTSCTIEQRQVAKSGRNAGQESWRPLGYHGSIKAAAESLLVRHLPALGPDEQVVSDLKALIRAVDEGAAKIVAAVERAKT